VYSSPPTPRNCSQDGHQDLSSTPCTCVVKVCSDCAAGVHFCDA
jgi:hypothetical protein